MLNLGGLMMLIIYIYAVIGVNIFAEIKLSGSLNRFLNFKTTASSFITLIRVVTGENWNDLMTELSKGYSIDYPCIQNPTWADYNASGETLGCGDPVLATCFFISFIVVVGLIFMNLFIAIILQGYQQTIEIEK
jgi:voltage-gated cation channel